MPVRKVRFEDLETVVAELEQKNRILDIGYPNDACAVVHYEPRGKRSAPGDVETRG